MEGRGRVPMWYSPRRWLLTAVSVFQFSDPQQKGLGGGILQDPTWLAELTSAEIQRGNQRSGPRCAPCQLQGSFTLFKDRGLVRFIKT